MHLPQDFFLQHVAGLRELSTFHYRLFSCTCILMCSIIAAPSFLLYITGGSRVGRPLWIAGRPNQRRVNSFFCVPYYFLIAFLCTVIAAPLSQIIFLPLGRVCNVKNQPPSFEKLTFIPCRTPWYLNKRTLKVQILQLVWQKCKG